MQVLDGNCESRSAGELWFKFDSGLWFTFNSCAVQVRKAVIEVLNENFGSGFTLWFMFNR